MGVPALPATVQDPVTNTAIQTAWGDQVNLVADWLMSSKCRARVFNNAAVSIPNSTRTAVTFNSERHDTGGCHSTSSNTSRLTVPASSGGLYSSGACDEFASNATGTRQAEIRLNGTTIIAVQLTDAVSAGGKALNVSADYMLAAADYLENTVFQTSGGALNVQASGNYSPEFWFKWESN